MNTRQWISIVAAAVLGAVIAYWLAPPRNTASSAAQDRKVLYWYDPMVPNQRFDKPGKSPFMDMQLVPRYADEAAGAGAESSEVRIDPRIMSNLGIRLATVERGNLPQHIEAVGMIGFNQRDVAIVQARAQGFVTRVYDRAPGDVIERDAPLVDLLIPEWTGAQTEFLALLSSNEPALAEAARQRLLLLGMTESLIAKLEAKRTPDAAITIAAPISGVIESLEVRAGMTVGASATLAKINGLSTVWLEAAVPELQSAAIEVSRAVQAELAAFPAEKFTGRVIAILPEANAETRTVRVRVELPNRELRFKPGMYARVRLDSGASQPALLIPSEAVIRTGARNLVMVAGEQGRFMPVEVQIGAESAGKTVVLSGLQEGQRVVASGQFLIDSEASLSGLSKLENAQSATDVGAEVYATRGRIESISAREIVIAHEPVAALNWPAMTMPFRIENPQQIQGLRGGEQVEFKFRATADGYVLEQAMKVAAP